jgi:FAD/FMN-containing dehydrogenase
MNRREFCRTSLAASVALSQPFLQACQRKQAGPGIPAVTLDGAEIELERSAVEELAGRTSGRVLLSDHADYDTARKIWNGMHDRRPALIVQPRSAEDVSQAVTFARERSLLVAVKGGGHSWPGKSTCDRGLMIDLSPMNAVSVDAGRKRAFADGGALLSALDTRSLEHGLVTTAGVVSHTGVGGLTLGGGFGRLNRKYGLTIDNLVSAEIVTADGRIRSASAEQEPDLFWAVRGGGGNFGVVTKFEYQLHPFDRNVLSGMIVWPIDQARQVLDFYRDWHEGLSDELYTGPVMITMPDGKSVIAMEVVYNGDPAKGEKELAPLRRVGKPAEDGVKVQDYMVMQTGEDATFKHGRRSYIKNGMAARITPALVEAMIEAFRSDPRLAFFTHTAGGAVKRVDELATAFPHRNAETMIIVGSVWDDPAQDEEVIEATRAWFRALEPHTGGYYSNIEYERANPEAGAYGPAYARLQKVKAQYDPGNLFRLNNNVLPAARAS